MQLHRGLTELGYHPTETQLHALIQTIDSLQKANQTLNLTSIDQPDQIVDLHLLDSLTIKPWMESLPTNAVVLDVGSGAGFPGIPLAIMHPNIRFQLIDARRKKIHYVQQLIDDLKLPNITASHHRLEEITTAPDMIVVRAVSSCSTLLKWSKHLGKVPMLMMKGKYPSDELTTIQCPFKCTRVHIPHCEAIRHIVCLHPNSDL